MEKMQYNDPKEYALMKSYEKSVDTGMMSPLVGYEKYKEYHQRVETELVGLKTNGGVVIRSQSKHFLERVFGTISDLSHGGVKRECRIRGRKGSFGTWKSKKASKQRQYDFCN